MITVLDLSKLSQAVYTLAPVKGWTMVDHRSSWRGLLSEGLQAAVYESSGGEGTVVAFRGTNISWRVLGALQDVVADLNLGSGQNTAYFSAAERFASTFEGRSNVVLCGHSLGGAIAQIVGRRRQFRFATFNAPGVAVIACDNIDEIRASSTIMNGVRTLGMIGSAIIDPVQAYSDIRGSFRQVRGLNVCLNEDPVSPWGLHYGKMKHIPAAPLLSGESAHSISVVIRSLESHPEVGDLAAFDID